MYLEIDNLLPFFSKFLFVTQIMNKQNSLESFAKKEHGIPSKKEEHLPSIVFFQLHTNLIRK